MLTLVRNDGEGSTAKQIQTCNGPGRVGLSKEHIWAMDRLCMPVVLLSHDARIPGTQLFKNEHLNFLLYVLVVPFLNICMEHNEFYDRHPPLAF